MSWLRKLGHFKKFAQSFPLSIDGIREAKRQAMLSPDIPGQGYLFQGPGVAEHARMRGSGSKTVLDQMLQMFTSIFDIFSYMENKIDDDMQIDEGQVEDEAWEYAKVYMEEHQFSDDDIWSMIRFIDETVLKPIIESSISSTLSRLHDQTVVQALLQNIMERKNDFEFFFETQMDIDFLVNALQNPQLNNENLHNSLFEQYLVDFTAEILKGIAESNGRYVGKTSLNEEFPEWLSEDSFLDGLKECKEATDWYLSENEDSLKEVAYQSIGEQNKSYFEEHKRENEHRFGFDVMGILSEDYDPEFYDERDEMLLSQISEICNRVILHFFKNGEGVDKEVNTLIYSIKKVAEANETTNFIFSHDLNITQTDPKKVNNGLNLLATGHSGIQVFGPLATHFQELRNAHIEKQKRLEEEEQRKWEEKQIKDREERQAAEIRRQEETRLRVERERVERERVERESRELQERLILEQEQENIRHTMLPTHQEEVTPEQLNRMKELGIAKRPFQHSTELSRSSFPGSGFSAPPSGNMVSFTMAISPGKGYLGKDKIPKDLMTELHLHSTPTKGEPALGWVGGYADYDNKILYISEVQSDIMQRTPYMRDPKKSREQTQEEIALIQQQISNINNKIQNAVSPRKLLEQKIQRIYQENETLKIRIQTQPQQSDVFQRKIQNNQQLIDNLLRQLPKSPDIVDTTDSQNQLSILQNNLSEAKQKLNNVERYPADRGNRFVKEYPQWHDYKSKVENLFKDWIPIFFNSAFRLAKSKGYERVRIITSDALMKMWERYARPETKNLFERVYDSTAAFYGAQKIEVNNTEWWEVMMSNPDLRIAQNWLVKLIKKSQQIPRHEWLVQYGNKFVWQIHFDKFFEVMKKKLPELAGEEQWGAQEGDYAASEGKNHVFQMWLEEVPQELKIGNDLEPEFKKHVRNYVLSTQGFDPYENDEQQETEIPSSDELESWFNP